MNELKRKIATLFSDKSFFVSGGVTFLFRLGGMGLNFLITFYLTRVYGDAVFGQYTLAFTLAQATAMVFALGLPNAMISYLGIKDGNDPFSQFLLKKGLRILMAASILPAVTYFLGAGRIAQHIFSNPALGPYIMVVALTVPAMILHEFLLYFLIATRKFRKFNLFMFVVPNVLFLTLLGISTVGEGHYTLLYYTAALLITILVEATQVFKRRTAPSPEKLRSRDIVRFAFPMMFSSLMLFLLNWTDVFLLGMMLPDKQVGHYNLAYKIASLSMMVIISLNVVLAPKVAELYNSGRMGELHQTVKRTTWVVILATLPLTAGLVLFSDFILSVFGPGFAEARTTLIIISIGFLLNAMTGNVDQILNMTGNQKMLKNITIAGFFTNLLLNLALIPHYGIEGSALASLFTNVLFNLACLLYIRKRLGFYTFC